MIWGRVLCVNSLIYSLKILELTVVFVMVLEYPIPLIVMLPSSETDFPLIVGIFAIARFPCLDLP